MLEHSIATLAGFSRPEEIYRSASTLVARAVRLRDNLRVVIKCSASEYPSLREEAARRNEFDMLGALASPNIIRVHGLERLHNRLLLIQEDFEGVTIGAYFRSHEVSIDGFLAMAVALADALAAVHAAGIVHKDISPNNILIDPRTQAVKLIDFGISSRLARESLDVRSPDGIQGTLAYISPEQTCRMNRAVDFRSDLYSLGATLYHLLAKVPPFDDRSALELVHAHIAREPHRLREIDDRIPVMVAGVIEKLMSKALETRYQSALGLRHDLALCAKHTGSPAHVVAFALAERDVPTRFEIPQHMYGREREIDVVLSGFERAASGPSELLLVGGYSGIGKSSLVKEVHKPIVTRRGYFIAGKFDQFNRGVPYSAIGQAFHEMVETIFTESAERVALWKAQILELAGPNGRMLIDVIPALEQLIGPQPAVAELAPADAQSRFSVLMQRLVRIFAQADHPLVVFLDDLQWADNSSLQLLESLLGTSRTEYLYVITAYRDNEVWPGHPFLLAVDNLRTAGTPIHEIVLAPLALADAGSLIASTLRRTPGETQPLTELLHDKTGGNPFFLIQLLHSFHDTGLVRFDPASASWTWELERILEVGITRNIVDVMTARLRRLPAACTAVLTAAACIGGTFDLKTLATVCELPYHSAAHELWPALSEGLLVCGSSDHQAADERLAPDGPGGPGGDAHAGEIRDQLYHQLREEIESGRFNVRYRFLHDQVQQAAYQLIPARERRERHLHIGRLLLRWCTSDAVRDELIFELTNHFNLAVELVTDPGEQIMLAKLNLLAGIRAKIAAAHRAAVHHFSVAFSLVGPDAWHDSYELMFGLHKHLADCYYLLGDHAASEQLSRQAIAHGGNTLDLAELYATRVQMLTTGTEFAKATQAGVAALTLLGFTVPDGEPATSQACARERARIEQRFAASGIEALGELPAIEDRAKAQALELLAHTWCAVAFSRNVPLANLMIYWLVTTSLDHGNAAPSGLGYALLGMVYAIEGDRRRGYELGLLGRRVVEGTFSSPAYTVRVFNIFANSLNCAFNHLETNLPLYMTSYRVGSQVGDLIYSVWAALHVLLLRVTKGDNLAEVYADSEKYLPFVRDTKDRHIINSYELNRQMLLCLQDLTPVLGSLDSDGFDEAERVSRYDNREFPGAILWYGHYKVGVHVILGQYAQALELSLSNESVDAGGAEMWSYTNHYFYQTIALLQAYPDAGPAARAEYHALIQRNMATLTRWSETGAVNFLHRLELLRAEQARVDGRPLDAVVHYDRALDHAARGRFTHDEALALELAGHFYRLRGRHRVARVYLTDAYYAYARWGAVAKTRILAQDHGDLLLITREPGKSSPLATLGHITHSEGNHQLDLVTVLKATQAISSEIVQDKLVTTVMSILSENAGAERGVLLLERGGQLVVEVTATGAGATLVRRALADYPDLPIGVVNLVHRSRRSIVLDDAQRDARFVGDPYVVRVRPKSVLCLPIVNQGRLRGVAYFENNLSCGVFTTDRLVVLDLLVSQAAISIENAALYGELESRVAERTVALRNSLDELTLAQVDIESANAALRKEIQERKQIELELRLAQKLESVGRLAAGIAHEINTPIQFVQDQVSFVREGAGDLIEVIRAHRELQSAVRAGGSAQLIAQLDELHGEVDLEFLSDRVPQALDQALYGLGRVATLVRSMKEFAHADQRDKAPSDINRALTATLSMTSNEYKYIADVRTQLGDIPNVVCHISELNQCFLNLIVNAAHAIADVVDGTDRRGVIEVTTQAEDGMLVVAISDTGTGIPIEVRDKIFDPFFTTKTLGRGTGQGLAIARSVIVDKHGGTLTFETELGRGTTFYVRLPIAGDAQQQVTAA